jgi:hypothetical protein
MKLQWQVTSFFKIVVSVVLTSPAQRDQANAAAAVRPARAGAFLPYSPRQRLHQPFALSPSSTSRRMASERLIS